MSLRSQKQQKSLRLSRNPVMHVELCQGAAKAALDVVQAVSEELKRQGISPSDKLANTLSRALTCSNALLDLAAEASDDLGKLIDAMPDEVIVEFPDDVQVRPCAPQVVDADIESSKAKLPIGEGRLKSDGRQPTEEQRLIQLCDAHEITVSALAGTGKTTTLIGYAQNRSRQRFLYIAFNRSVAEEARRRFPENVDSKTSHALAYPQFGQRYKGSKLGNPKARDVHDFLESAGKLLKGTKEERYHFSKIVLSRVGEFLQSGSLDPEIGMKRTLPIYRLLTGREVDGALVAECANAVWQVMQDADNPAVPMNHDGYLKLYCLSKPDLSKYDRILLDESQDTNMAVFSMMGRQETGKLLVGDPNQAIYGFRGARNVMDKLRDAERYSLTQSFRFGPHVAEVANHLLRVFCGEPLRLVGAGTDPGEGDHARLFRTNAGLFAGAVGWMEANKERGTGLHLIGDLGSYNLGLLTDAWFLKERELHQIQDPFLRGFKTYDQFKEYAEAIEDRELLARVKTVDTYGAKIPSLVDQVRKWNVPAEQARVKMTTAHKSKGLEFSTVTLGEDFPELMGSGGVPRLRAFVGPFGDSLPIEEAYLLYVASTRAKSRLNLNSTMTDFVRWARENPEEVPIGASSETTTTNLAESNRKSEAEMPADSRLPRLRRIRAADVAKKR